MVYNTMKDSETLAMFVWIILAMFGFIIFLVSLTPEPPSETLCIYKIPNHIRFSCPEGNETRTINAFGYSPYQYYLTVTDYNCTYTGVGDGIEGFHYEMDLCSSILPFNRTKTSNRI